MIGGLMENSQRRGGGGWKVADDVSGTKSWKEERGSPKKKTLIIKKTYGTSLFQRG